MNDEEKLNMTERKLLNISRRCSLVEYSQRKIVKNLDFYQEHEQHGRKLKSLPVCLRDRLLRELTSLKFDGGFWDSIQNFERKLKDFSFLLSFETKEIELDGLMSFCPEEIIYQQLTRVVQMIAADAPNVQSLMINGRNFMRKKHLYRTLDRASIEAICSLSKLKKLKISMSLRVEFCDLMKICETLQFLEYVDITIDDELLEFSADKFKRSFSRLKVFLFSGRSIELCRKLIRFCIQHLPKVRLLNYLDFTLEPVDFDKLKLPPGTSSLMNLCVYPTTLPIHQHFPEVRRLAKTKLDANGT
ncbi:Hypothetical predicted protein [Cloeon dipterum]|uniref:F-box domain-containing protein n=1 Tax=Cloeon dipterum TaxID=197152 RepID=A0A8S1DQF9_9INSE|nr:Hypothetical predicted protein [Cloeon dipterum]